MKTMRRASALSATWWVALLALLHAGCASVEHVSAYRNLRADFNGQSRVHNQRVLSDAFAPLSPDTSGPPGTSDPTAALSGTVDRVNLASLQEEAEGWQGIFEQASALNRRAEAELRADGLLGASLALEIVAEARAATARHLLQNSTATAPATQPAEPITAAVARADAVLADSTIPLYDRDRYMLQTLRPTVRYEIAIVELRKLVADQQARNADALDPIEAAIALAEREYEDGMGRYPPNALPHATLSRLIMLQSGETIVTGQKFMAHISLPLDGQILGRPGFAAIAQRIDHFREQALRTDVPTEEARLLARLAALRSTNTESALAAAGLSSLTR